jgi:hypothetical protein
MIEIFFGPTFFVTIVDCWTWIFNSGYVIFGWWSVYGWIWFEFYSWWWLYELMYIFIWEVYDIKIEVYYLEIEMIYFVITWSSLTIFIWYYLNIIVWEFKYVCLFWIFHWQITWNLTWTWWFSIYYIHWVLPVVIFYVPIIYIPPIVDIEVLEEKYYEDTLELAYELTDLYGNPVVGAVVNVQVNGVGSQAIDMGGGIYEVNFNNVDTSSPVNILVDAAVPNVALVDSLDYTIDLTEYCVCPECPDSTIPGFQLIPVILVSTAAIVSVALIIRKKMRVD